MPLYEFQCEPCRSVVELLVRRDESPACPQCGSRALVKLMSSPVSPQGTSLPLMNGCPPPSAGPCGVGCCRLPMDA